MIGKSRRPFVDQQTTLLPLTLNSLDQLESRQPARRDISFPMNVDVEMRVSIQLDSRVSSSQKRDILA